MASSGAARKPPVRAEKRLNSAADFGAFYPLSQPEAGFRENVWQSGAQNGVPKNG